MNLLLHLRRILFSIVFGISIVAIVLLLYPYVTVGQGRNRVYDDSVADVDVIIDNNELLRQLNQMRRKEGFSGLKQDNRLCELANSSLEKVVEGKELDQNLTACPACEKQVILSLTGTYEEDVILEQLAQGNDNDLYSEDYDSICIASQHDQVVLSLGKVRQTVTTDTGEIRYVTPTFPPMRNIPDQEVVEAVNTYRADHHVPQLVVNQNLCTYAEKRTQDLVANGGLDAHEGFKRDFEDGNVPVGIRDYSGGRIGENLAHQFCYRGSKNVVANTGTALIEWCFDSSTAGHREAQLNPSYTAVCVRHAQNMYVVIFGE